MLLHSTKNSIIITLYQNDQIIKAASSSGFYYLKLSVTFWIARICNPCLQLKTNTALLLFINANT